MRNITKEFLGRLEDKTFEDSGKLYLIDAQQILQEFETALLNEMQEEENNKIKLRSEDKVL